MNRKDELDKALLRLRRAVARLRWRIRLRRVRAVLHPGSWWPIRFRKPKAPEG